MTTFDFDGPDPNDWTLAEAQAWLLDQLDDGATCPCCDQHAQRYRWTLPGSAIKVLLRNYRVGGTTQFIESKTVKRVGQGGLHSILAMWDLVEEEKVRRPDGGKSGWWRVTGIGERFIQGGLIRKYAYIYDNRVSGHDGPWVSISDRLGEPFDWRQHMDRWD